MSGATRDLTSPHTMQPDLWEPDLSDIKTYRHFDGHISPDEIRTLVRDPIAVARHSFYPLLHFEKKWRRAPKRDPDGKLEKRKPKSRPIRYACRRDSYIYKHYRQLISPRYEAELTGSGLNDCVLAYRKVPVAPGATSCKSNIHFAKEAFEAIDAMGTCCAVAIDISSFFESINHQKLKERWASIIGQNRLPDDHFAVFRSLTTYRYVDVNKAFLALGYSKIVDGVLRYAVDPTKIPTKICSPSLFRERILNTGLIEKHDKVYGIPQGTPISDLMANLFLLDFDRAMLKYVTSRKGRYFRYSDDILLVLPGDGRAARAAASTAQKEIKKAGDELAINPEKTEIVCFTPGAEHRCYTLRLAAGGARRIRKSENEGLAYLGFRYDGESVYLRNSTISNLRGKIARTCRAVSYGYVKGHEGKDLTWLLANLPINDIKQKYLQVRDFEEAVGKAVTSGDAAFSVMTFWSYALRASRHFKADGAPILRQLRGIEKMIVGRLRKEVERRYATRNP